MEYVGQEKAKSEIKQILDMGLAFPDRKSLARTILLYGCSGVGKTQIVKNLSLEYNINFFPVSPSDIYGKYIGESEKNLRNVFQTAFLHQPSLIFLDEAEVLISKRTTEDSECSARVKNEMLTLLEGFNSEFGQVWIIGASNRPSNIDPSFRGRFKRFIKFEMPTEDERYELIHTIANSNKIHLEPKEDGLRAISRKTDGFSHRDMRNLMEKAFQIGPEERVYKATHYKVEELGDFDTFFPFSSDEITHCKCIEMHFRDIPEEALKWPPLKLTDIEKALGATQKSQDTESKKNISDFEASLMKHTNVVQNDTKEECPKRMVCCIVLLFIIGVIAIIWFQGGF